MHRYLCHIRSSKKGQATLELAVCLIVLVIFVYGIIQFAHMISIWTRLAAVAREGGRAHVALSYDPVTYPTDAFTIMEDMIQPGKITDNGGMCFTIIRREGSGISSDKMIVVAKHYKNAAGISNFSKIGIAGAEVPASVLPIDLVTVEQTVVAVEVYYDFSKDTITPIGSFLSGSDVSKAYEIAFF